MTQINITEQFIQFFNNKTQNQVANLKLEIPEIKIASINTNSFFDKQNGIKSFIELNLESNNTEEFCKKTKICPEIGKSIKSFSEINDYAVIIDSSKELPTEFKDQTIKDVTIEFIGYYNKSYQK